MLPVMKLVQFLMYGDLHLPLGPSVAGPGSVYPVMALSDPAGGGNATHAAPSCGSPTLDPPKFKFSIKHPLLT